MYNVKVHDFADNISTRMQPSKAMWLKFETKLGKEVGRPEDKTALWPTSIIKPKKWRNTRKKRSIYTSRGRENMEMQESLSVPQESRQWSRVRLHFAINIGFCNTISSETWCSRLAHFQICLANLISHRNRYMRPIEYLISPDLVSPRVALLCCTAWLFWLAVAPYFYIVLWCVVGVGSLSLRLLLL